MWGFGTSALRRRQIQSRGNHNGLRTQQASLSHRSPSVRPRAYRTALARNERRNPASAVGPNRDVRKRLLSTDSENSEAQGQKISVRRRANRKHQPIPARGPIKRLYVATSTAPGTPLARSELRAPEGLSFLHRQRKSSFSTESTLSCRSRSREGAIREVRCAVNTARSEGLEPEAAAAPPRRYSGSPPTGFLEQVRRSKIGIANSPRMVFSGLERAEYAVSTNPLRAGRPNTFEGRGPRPVDYNKEDSTHENQASPLAGATVGNGHKEWARHS